MNPATTTFALMTLGLHHGDEVPADSAGKWLALVQTDGAWALEEARIAIAPAEDPVLDDGQSEPTGRRVSAPDLVAEPVILLRGPGLVAGPLVVATEAPRALFPGDKQALALPGGEPTTIQSLGRVARTEWGAIRLEQYGLVAMAGASFVDLFPEAALDAEGELPRVVFAGDLDRDDKLDLLVDTSDHYNASELTLFLSGAAKRGKPLAPVAKYRTTGA